MPDWDADSSTLHSNLQRVLRNIRDNAQSRHLPDLKEIKHWHREVMLGLNVPDEKYIGAFRGEPGLEMISVRIGAFSGTPPASVADELAAFEQRLHQALNFLDPLIAPGEQPDAETLGSVIDICAWAHAEWVRIHPFANGNGRIARLLANSIAMRYGLPPFIRLRPRPQGDAYANAAALAMQGDWQPTAGVFNSMLLVFLNNN